MNSMRILLACAALGGALPAEAGVYRAGAVEVVDPWTRPAAAGQTGVGYMVIKNAGKTPVVLTGAQTPLAPKVTLHQTNMANGVMRMAPVVGGLTIAPGASAALAPAGYHLMIEGLAKPLTAGQTAPLTLLFADGRKMRVDLSVQTSAAPGGMGSMSGMKH
jgi:hypothetical protein